MKESNDIIKNPVADTERSAMPLAIIISRQGMVKFITRELAMLLGYTINDLLGKSVIDLFVPEPEVEERRSQLDFIFKQERLVEKFDISIKSKHGNKIKFKFNILKLESADGNTDDLVLIGDDLSKTQKVVSTLNNEQKQLEQVIDATQEFVIVIDKSESLSIVNETARRKLGFKAGMSFRDLLDPSDVKHTTSFLNSLSNISSSSNINLVLLHPVSRKRFYLSGAVSSIVEDGQLVNFRLILHDVTEKTKSEKARDLYYSIAHHSIHSKNLDELYYNIHKELKAVVDCENLYIALIEEDHNDRFISFPYYQESHVPGTTRVERKFGDGLTEFLIEAGEPQLFTKKDLIKLKEEGKFEIHGDLPEIWLGVPLKVKNEIIGVVAIQSYHSESFYTSRDLKLLDFASSQIAMAIDMVRTQEKLIAQTAKLNSIIESGSHLIWTVNSDLELTSFNKNYFDAIINNYDILPTIQEGSTDSERQYPSFWDEKYEQAFSGEQVNFEITLKDNKGQDIWKEIYLNPIYLEEGKIEEISGIANDITEKKKSEKALIEAKELAEESLKVKEQFLANMSHEIRTPLNGIIGVLDLFSFTDLGKEQKAYLKTIKSSSETLLNILNDILDLSKLEAGKMSLNYEPISTEKLIKKIKSLFASRASGKMIKFNIHASKKLPAVIEADQMRIIQVVSNLLANSIKFTPRGGSIDLNFDVKKETKTHALLKVDVRDSGIGIKSKDVDRLFKSFTQLDTSTTKAYGGTGLGLSITKELVELMGGEIGVTSSPGLGSTFWFTMQVKKSNARIKPGKKEKKGNKSLLRFTKVKPKILVVDDNLVNREVAGEILKKSGCEVDLASNGLEAVLKAKSNPYDIIFMDIQMPEMDGIEANQQIKKQKKEKQPTVVAMTAYSMKEDEKRFLDAGLDDYIPKPIRASQIIAKVEEIMFGATKTDEVAVTDNTRPQIINIEVVSQLEKFGGKEMIISAFKDFEGEAKVQINECNDALKKSDYSVIQKHLHTLKGSAGTLGIERVAQIAKETEGEMKLKEYSRLSKGLKELNDSFVEFRENFSNIISNY